MVKLTKIYTRTGDDGSTGLGDGERVPKTDIRVEAYGTVDEANAAVGLAIVQAEASVASNGPAASRHGEIGRLLKSIQHDLFDVGADLCCPVPADEKPGARLRITAAQTKRLEDAIDTHNDRLRPLNSFILPDHAPSGTSHRRAPRAPRRNDESRDGEVPQPVERPAVRAVPGRER